MQALPENDLQHLKTNDVFGPVKMGESHILCRIDSSREASVDQPEVLSELECLFIDEVWRTLEVKYVS